MACAIDRPTACKTANAVGPLCCRTGCACKINRQRPSPQKRSTKVQRTGQKKTPEGVLLLYCY